MKVWVEIKGSDSLQLSKKITRFIPGFKLAWDKLYADAAEYMLVATRQHASGPPGPSIRTGDYVSRIEKHQEGDTWVVGTNHPAGHRLEYGFVGTDSLGRHYADPPRPHFRPAAEETQIYLSQEARRLPRRMWEGRGR